MTISKKKVEDWLSNCKKKEEKLVFEYCEQWEEELEFEDFSQVRDLNDYNHFVFHLAYSFLNHKIIIKFQYNNVFDERFQQYNLRVHYPLNLKCCKQPI